MFSDFLIKRYEAKHEGGPREGLGAFAGTVGLGANLFLSCIELVAGVLSRSVSVIAEAVIDDRRAQEAVQRLRDRVFPPSWAQDSLDNLIAAARAEVQASGVMIPDDYQLPGAMGRGSNSPLDRIARVAVDADLDRSHEADAVWARALQDLSWSGDADDLVRTLRMWEDGVEKEIPSHRLFDGLDADSRIGFSGSAMTAVIQHRQT